MSKRVIPMVVAPPPFVVPGTGGPAAKAKMPIDRFAMMRQVNLEAAPTMDTVSAGQNHRERLAQESKRRAEVQLMEKEDYTFTQEGVDRLKRQEARLLMQEEEKRTRKIIHEEKRVIHEALEKERKRIEAEERAVLLEKHKAEMERERQKQEAEMEAKKKDREARMRKMKEESDRKAREEYKVQEAAKRAAMAKEREAQQEQMEREVMGAEEELDRLRMKEEAEAACCATHWDFSRSQETTSVECTRRVHASSARLYEIYYTSMKHLVCYTAAVQAKIAAEEAKWKEWEEAEAAREAIEQAARRAQMAAQYEEDKKRRMELHRLRKETENRLKRMENFGEPPPLVPPPPKEAVPKEARGVVPKIGSFCLNPSMDKPVGVDFKDVAAMTKDQLKDEHNTCVQLKKTIKKDIVSWCDALQAKLDRAPTLEEKQEIQPLYKRYSDVEAHLRLVKHRLESFATDEKAKKGQNALFSQLSAAATSTNKGPEPSRLKPTVSQLKLTTMLEEPTATPEMDTLTLRKKQVKKSIQDWCTAFQTANGVAPTVVDKKEIQPLYEEYAQLDAKLKSLKYATESIVAETKPSDPLPKLPLPDLVIRLHQLLDDASNSPDSKRTMAECILAIHDIMDELKCVGFLKVDGVEAESPAALAGLQVGDQIARFGSVVKPATGSTHSTLIREVVTHVNARVSKGISISLKRGDTSSSWRHLVLKPQKWKGKGLLGCVLQPFEAAPPPPPPPKPPVVASESPDYAPFKALCVAIPTTLPLSDLIVWHHKLLDARDELSKLQSTDDASSVAAAMTVTGQSLAELMHNLMDEMHAIPFLKVEGVEMDSPAATAGLLVGDLLGRVGDVMYYAGATHATLIKDLVGLVNERTNRGISISILRGNLTWLSLVLRPQKWKGQGLLGCILHPFEAPDKFKKQASSPKLSRTASTAIPPIQEPTIRPGPVSAQMEEETLDPQAEIEERMVGNAVDTTDAAPIERPDPTSPPNAHPKALPEAVAPTNVPLDATNTLVENQDEDIAAPDLAHDDPIAPTKQVIESLPPPTTRENANPIAEESPPRIEKATIVDPSIVNDTSLLEVEPRTLSPDTTTDTLQPPSEIESTTAENTSSCERTTPEPMDMANNSDDKAVSADMAPLPNDAKPSLLEPTPENEPESCAVQEDDSINSTTAPAVAETNPKTPRQGDDEPPPPDFNFPRQAFAVFEEVTAAATEAGLLDNDYLISFEGMLVEGYATPAAAIDAFSKSVAFPLSIQVVRWVETRYEERNVVLQSWEGVGLLLPIEQPEGDPVLDDPAVSTGGAFAQVNAVYDSSPADHGGLMAGDLVFWIAEMPEFPTLESVSDWIGNQYSASLPIEVHVYRYCVDDERYDDITLSIQPDRWCDPQLHLSSAVRRNVELMGWDLVFLDVPTPQVVYPPFLLVEHVTTQSPAHDAGLLLGDLIGSLGRVTSSDQDVGAETHLYIDRPMPVQIGRYDVASRAVQTFDLSVTPQTWDGDGLLGCQMTVWAPQDMAPFLVVRQQVETRDDGASPGILEGDLILRVGSHTHEASPQDVALFLDANHTILLVVQRWQPELMQYIVFPLVARKDPAQASPWTHDSIELLGWSCLTYEAYWNQYEAEHPTELPCKDCWATTFSTVAHAAAYAGHLACLTYLGDYFDVFIVDDLGRTPLFYACYANQVACVTLLLSLDYSNLREAIDVNGDTPLHAATSGGALEAMQVLLQDGCSPEAINYSGMRPIHIAPSVQAMQVLATGQADLLALDGSGHMALAYACMAGDEASVRFLATECAEFIDYPDPEGDTPLHFAVAGGYFPCVQGLLTDSGRLNQENSSCKYILRPNKHNKTALDVARDKDLSEITVFLETNCDVDHDIVTCPADEAKPPPDDYMVPP
ncbi:Aste57867_3528 [Aphanomyces stellatus]|uniref:Aste57867_3528 protein n=1 Tax=Aphanomyces stellatus TaxID=120398 RepID=A0A485K9W1_9STRA|nr:hypothetical protein As57867_003517 [Aphanomyces stellatus]VFT80691.1 Aste57867_3528 [Aphanomyces stellatus]